MAFLPTTFQEEAFLKFMLARDVWPGNEDDNTAAAAAAITSASPVTPARISAGLEEGGRERLLESSLALLRRAQRLRDTGGKLSSRSPSSFSPSTSPRGNRHRSRANGSPLPSAPRSPKVLLSDSSLGGGGGGGGVGDAGSREKSAAKKRRRLFDASAAGGASGRRSPVGGVCLDDSARVRGNEGGRGGMAGQGDKEHRDGRARGEGAEEDNAEGESDVLRWQVPFVMGRLCAELGRDPRRVLENLADALRLAQVMTYDVLFSSIVSCGGEVRN